MVGPDTVDRCRKKLTQASAWGKNGGKKRCPVATRNRAPALVSVKESQLGGCSVPHVGRTLTKSARHFGRSTVFLIFRPIDVDESVRPSIRFRSSSIVQVARALWLFAVSAAALRQALCFTTRTMIEGVMSPQGFSLDIPHRAGRALGCSAAPCPALCPALHARTDRQRAPTTIPRFFVMVNVDTFTTVPATTCCPAPTRMVRPSGPGTGAQV